MKIRPIRRSVPSLNIPDLVAQELPFVNAFYNDKQALHDDVKDLFSFYIRNANDLPMYVIDRQCAVEAMATLTSYYAMLEDAVGRVFQQEDDWIIKQYDCTPVRQPGFSTFLAYARHTFARRRIDKADTVYGRFDAAIDPETGKITGVYELNGDTPVMLFESINLQNVIAMALGHTEDQANDWWSRSVERFKYLKGKAVAVVCDINFIEDAVSTETISQMFDAAGARVYYTNLQGLNHDLLDLERPFRVDGVDEAIDAVFTLLPWEEMWTSGKDILDHWQRWSSNIQFFEPPWRWFMSHKALFAYVTELLRTDKSFSAAWGDLPHIPTYLDNDLFRANNLDYVGKPVIGRLSQNISIYKGNTVTTSPGEYGGEPAVYQAYVPTGRTTEGNIILGGWMSDREVTTLCIREFNTDVPDLFDEHFVAHILEVET